MSWQPPPPPNKNSNPQQPNSGFTAKSQTFYDILQVNPSAHPTVIRYAYRYLAGIYHPDNVITGNTESFRQISDAFRILSDTGKRAAYDAQLGFRLTSPGAPAQQTTEQAPSKITSPVPYTEKASLAYNELELRLAILQLLLQARKKRVQTGGCSPKTLMDVLGTDMHEMEFALWYLREKGLIDRTEAVFMITVAGVDYLTDQLSRTHIIDEGPKTVPDLSSSIS